MDGEKLFAVYTLNDAGKENAQDIQRVFNHFLDALTETVEPRNICAREWALVKTKLEEASFFAKKAMAMLPENHLEK